MSKAIGIQLIDSTNDGELMDLKIEPVRDAEGKITSGMVIGHTLEQNKALILLTQPGEFKFRADLGVGIEDIVLDSDFLEYRHKIRSEFAKDGLRTTRIDLYPGKPFKVDASYGS